MTIHSEHPFLPPEGERNPLRRVRGRLPAPVTVWTTQQGTRRVGWTVSSILIADGHPGEVVALIDEESDLWELAALTGTVAISALGWQHRTLADGFAGVGPAPGGAFKLGTWTDTDWGPVLTDAAAWLGVRLVTTDPPKAGWGLLVRGRIERTEINPATEPIYVQRGRYRQLG